jgi:hypothetical protein
MSATRKPDLTATAMVRAPGRRNPGCQRTITGMPVTRIIG